MATNQSITDGIPTARNVDHFGYNVPNLDEAIDFFVEVLGAEEAFHWGPMADPDGDSMAAMLGVHPRTSVSGALLRLGPASNVELLEYDAPDEASEPPKTADPGASQLAFRVEDVEAATEYLREQQGVTVLDEPGEVPDDEPHAGMKSVFAPTPWGLLLELVEHGTLPYEQDTDARLWGATDESTTDRSKSED